MVYDEGATYVFVCAGARSLGSVNYFGKAQQKDSVNGGTGEEPKIYCL